MCQPQGQGPQIQTEWQMLLRGMLGLPGKQMPRAERDTEDSRVCFWGLLPQRTTDLDVCSLMLCLLSCVL